MQFALGPGYTVRRPAMADAEQVQALTAACDLEDFGEAEGFTLDEIHDEWASLNLDQDAWLVLSSGGNIVGYAVLRHRQHVRFDVEGFVHPAHRNNGVGTTLVRMSETRAIELLPLAPVRTRVVIHNWINAADQDACALLEREGYAPFRYFLRMEIALETQPDAPAWPSGFSIRTFHPGDEEIYFQTTEEAMSDHWGHVATTLETWTERHIGNTFEPSLWFLLMDHEQPVAVALCSLAGEIGWVDTLAVRKPWRQRGLGTALLRYTFSAFGKRGIERIVLGVDAESPTNATRLYEGAGMIETRRYATYGKELREGEVPA